MNISQSLNIRVHKNKTIQYALYLLFFRFIHIVDCADRLYNFFYQDFICCHWKQDTPNEHNGIPVNFQVK
jgi:hypothetical protein